jgi:sugar lactone lactonase YvrE
MDNERPEPGLRLLSDHRFQLGEGPWWSVREDRLYWVDIVGRSVQRAALDGSSYQRWEVPSDVGFVVPHRDGGAVLGLRDGLHRLDLDTGVTRLLLPLEADQPDQRFNDGKCDPQGRLWFGSMRDDCAEPVGSLYRYDGGASAMRVVEDVLTSNGLGWSPDGTRLYYTDSPRQRIDQFDFDAETGTVSARTTFAPNPAQSSPLALPDGLAVDSAGFVWSAMWDGGCVFRFAPDGSLDRTVRLPVARPTSCMFAGPDLSTLVITSALDGPGVPSARPELAGATFLLDVAVPGLPEVGFAPR